MRQHVTHHTMHSGQCLFVSTESLDSHWDRALRETYLKHVVPIHLGSSVRPKIPMDRAPMKTQSSMTRQHHPLHQLTSQHTRLLSSKVPILEDSLLEYDSYCLAKGANRTKSNKVCWPPTDQQHSIGQTQTRRAGMAVGRIRW